MLNRNSLIIAFKFFLELRGLQKELLMLPDFISNFSPWRNFWKFFVYKSLHFLYNLVCIFSYLFFEQKNIGIKKVAYYPKKRHFESKKFYLEFLQDELWQKNLRRIFGFVLNENFILLGSQFWSFLLTFHLAF